MDSNDSWWEILVYSALVAVIVMAAVSDYHASDFENKRGWPQAGIEYDLAKCYVMARDNVSINIDSYARNCMRVEGHSLKDGKMDRLARRWARFFGQEHTE